MRKLRLLFLFYCLKRHKDLIWIYPSVIPTRLCWSWLRSTSLKSSWFEMFGCPKRRESFWVNAFLLIEEETLGIVQCKRFSKEEYYTTCYFTLDLPAANFSANSAPDWKTGWKIPRFFFMVAKGIVEMPMAIIQLFRKENSKWSRSSAHLPVFSRPLLLLLKNNQAIIISRSRFKVAAMITNGDNQ